MLVLAFPSPNSPSGNADVVSFLSNSSRRPSSLWRPNHDSRGRSNRHCQPGFLAPRRRLRRLMHYLHRGCGSPLAFAVLEPTKAYRSIANQLGWVVCLEPATARIILSSSCQIATAVRAAARRIPLTEVTSSPTQGRLWTGSSKFRWPAGTGPPLHRHEPRGGARANLQLKGSGYS